MSQVNAPQPTPSGGAAEVFDSTIEPAAPTVSSTGLPGPTPAEGAIHAGTINGIDPYLRSQYIATSTPTWSTAMAPGTLVFSKPIHPQSSHQYLAHLSKMYNVFVGGIDYVIKVCGTGFHAGALMVVRIPPNYKPQEISKLEDITAFEYKIIDPKTLEVVSQTVIDQRNVMYHYLPLDLDDYQSFGGHFAIYVNVPLNTSSSGSSQIAVQIFERPSVNFSFLQLRPLDLISPSFRVPAQLEHALNFRREQLSCGDARELMFMKFHPKTALRALFNHAWYGYNMHGDHMVSFSQLHGDMNQTWQVKYDTSPGDDCFRLKKAGFIQPLDQTSWPPVEGTVYGSIFNVTNDAYAAAAWTIKTNEQMQLDFTTISSMEPHFNKAWNPSEFEFDIEINLAMGALTFSAQTIDGFTGYSPPIDEALVTFQSELDLLHAQPYSLAKELQTGDYKDLIAPTDSLIFQLIDGNVDLVIALVRLHPQGYMTTHQQTAVKIFDLDDHRYYFKYPGVLPRTTPMFMTPGAPSLSEVALNYAASQLA